MSGILQQQAEQGKFISVPLSSVPSNFPNDGSTPYAVFTYQINPTTVSLSGSDIEIGAVELKDGTADTRATITSAGLLVNVVGVATSALQSTGNSSLSTIAANVATTVTAPGGTPTAVVNVQQAGAMSGFDNTGTSITGATFVALPSHACHSVTFLGGSVPCDIETATNATYATGITLPGLTVPVLANSNEITLQPTSQVGSAGIISFQYNS
jgi:hypothetical protein